MKSWIELVGNYDGERGWLVKKIELFRVEKKEDVENIAFELDLKKVKSTYENDMFLIFENGVKL